MGGIEYYIGIPFIAIMVWIALILYVVGQSIFM